MGELEHKFEVEILEREGKQKLPDNVKECVGAELHEMDRMKLKKEADLTTFDTFRNNVNSLNVNFVVPDFARAHVFLRANGFGDYFNHFNTERS